MHPTLRTLTTSVVLLALGTSCVLAEPQPLPLDHAATIGDGIAIFYPQGVDGRTLPSLALVEEPTETGPLPDSWMVAPSFSIDEGNVTAVIPVEKDTDLYGGGEVTGRLRRNGYKIEVWTTDNFNYSNHKGARLYQAHPWVMGVRPDGTAYGIIFDTTWRAQFETANESITYASQGPAFRVIVIDRDSPQAVLSGLAELTGHMPMPPRWALGFQQCKYSYFPDARVREIADEFRARDLPCDVIWMDIDYMDGFRVFTFDPERFPDPSATNDYLHSKGFKSVWMIDPGVKKDEGYFVYDTGTAQNVWVQNPDGTPFVGPVWPGDCVFPDFTMPETRKWWAGLYDDFMGTGMDGVWNDMNEPAVFLKDWQWTMNPDAIHRGGGDLPADIHARYHNVYGMLMVKASREGILDANPDKRPFVLTRSNYLGGHRYAATWTGDNMSGWSHLKLSIPMSITLGLSGQPFNGPDIGGFAGVADPVLYGHWISLGAFYPFSRAHKDNDKNAPDKEPWMFGPVIERVAQTALYRRYRLLPYLYTQMEATARSGVPVMQPVFFADPTDTELRREEEAFLAGPDLLVIPKWIVTPTLPKGDWRPVNLLDGDREDDQYQPEVRIRPGAIVPLGEVVQNTTEESLDPLTLLVHLDADGKAAGSLYLDDGDGFDFEQGDYARIRFVAERDGRKVTVRIDGQDGDRKVDLGKVRVQLVTGDGTVEAATGNIAKGVKLKVK